MDVIADGAQVTIAAAIDDQCLVTATKKMAEEFVPAIEAHSVGAQEPFHAGDEIGARGLDDKVKVIAHEAPGMSLPACALAGFAEGLQEQLPVTVILEDVLAAVAAVHDMVNGAFVLNTEFAGHRRILHFESPLATRELLVVQD